MKRISQFSPASFLFQGARSHTGIGANTATSTLTSTSSTSTSPSLGTDRATLGGGGGLSLSDQMRNLKAKVGKATGSWMEQAKQDLGMTSPESKAFKAERQERGWDVKGPGNRDDFTPEKMDGKPVAFRVKDEASGEMVEKKGFLRQSGEQGSGKFQLDGQKGEFDSKHIHDFAVNNDPNITKRGQQFRDKFEGENWTAKNHQNRNDFAPEDLHGREVAFLAKNPETGKLVEKRGFLEADPDPARSAMFKLKGQEGSFNNNEIREMAVNDSFAKGMKKEGWTVKDGVNRNDFSPDNLNGREVAFRVKDEKTGEMVERRGVMKASNEEGSAMFTLKGQNGEFNNNQIKDMAVNNKFGQEYRDRGWTVKDQSNADMFHARNLDGQHVAFRHPHPETGEMMHHAGKAEAVVSMLGIGLSMFSIIGMSGMFNSSVIPEMAYSPFGVEATNFNGLM